MQALIGKGMALEFPQFESMIDFFAKFSWLLILFSSRSAAAVIFGRLIHLCHDAIPSCSDTWHNHACSQRCHLIINKYPDNYCISLRQLPCSVL
jgi:hypothetical protein